MAKIQSLKQWLSRTLKGIRHPQLSFSASYLPRTGFDYRAEVGDGLSSGVVMAPVNWLARNFTDATLTISKRQTELFEVVPDHPLVNLINNPNPFYSGDALWQATVQSWLLDGNSYWLKNRSENGQIAELWFAPFSTINPKYPDDGSEFISHYEYSPAGIPIRVESEDIIHFRNGIDPNNPRIGRSPIYPVLREIFTDNEASNFTASVLRNQGIVGFVVSPRDSDILPDSDDILATKERFKTQWSGDHRGEPLIMGSPVDIKQFGHSLKDMELSAIRNISEERVCAALGINPAVVGFGSGLESTKVGATMREFKRLAWESQIIPTQKLNAQTLANQLLSEFELEPDQFKIEFDRSEVVALQEDQSALVTRIGQLYQQGIITRSEARRMLGHEVVEPRDDIFLISGSMFEVPSKDQLRLVEKKESKRDTTLPKPARDPRRRRPTRSQMSLQRNVANQSKKLESKFELELGRFLRALGRRAASVAEDVLNRKGLDDSVDADTIAEELGLAGLQKDLNVKGGTHYLGVSKMAFKEIETAVGVAVSLDDPLQQKILDAGGRRLGLVDLEKSTKKRLFREISEGRELEEGVGQIIKRIKDKVPAGRWRSPEVRSKVIARTETLNAQRVSLLEGYRSSGGVSRVVVVDDLLGYGDDDCTYWNGREVSLSEAEDLVQDEHPNGTRSFVPIIND